MSDILPLKVGNVYLAFWGILLVSIEEFLLCIPELEENREILMELKLSYVS